MTLIEMIGQFKTLEAAEKIASSEAPGIDLDVLDIYLINDLCIDSEVRFFNAEEIPGTLTFDFEGVQYVNLFPFFMGQEMIESFANLPQNLSDQEIAERLLDYRVKDA